MTKIKEMSQIMKMRQKSRGHLNKKKAKTWHLHTFCDSWLKVPELSGWLSHAKRDGVKQPVCAVFNDHFKHPNKVHY